MPSLGQELLGRLAVADEGLCEGIAVGSQLGTPGQDGRRGDPFPGLFSLEAHVAGVEVGPRISSAQSVTRVSMPMESNPAANSVPTPVAVSRSAVRQTMARLEPGWAWRP